MFSPKKGVVLLIITVFIKSRIKSTLEAKDYHDLFRCVIGALVSGYTLIFMQGMRII